MKINNIRYITGPSLFAAKASIVAEIFCSIDEQYLYKQDEVDAKKRAALLLTEIDTDLSLNRIDKYSGIFFIDFVCYMTTYLLEKMESYSCEPWITFDSSKEMIYIAFADTGKHLIANALNTAIQYTVALFIPTSDLKNNPNQLVSVFLSEGKKIVKPLNARLVQKALDELEIPWLPLYENGLLEGHYQINYGKYQRILDGSITFESSYMGIQMSLSKRQTNQFLIERGFPATKQIIVNNAQNACIASKTIGYPVVVKSEYGAFGDKVYPDLKNEHEVTQAFNIVASDIQKSNMNGRNILIEEFIQGKDYRVTVVDNRVIEVFYRIPAKVFGDGVHTVAELVTTENKSPLRGSKTSTHNIYVNLELNQAELFTLSKQNLFPSSIPFLDQEVFLRSNANWSCGGTYETITESIHPDNIELCARIAEAFKINIIGIDVIADDISRSFKDGKLRVIEVNHTPSMSLFNGLVDRLVPNAKLEKVPIVVVAENKYSTKISDLIGSMLYKARYSTGVVNTRGMYINSQFWTPKNSLNYHDPVLHILKNNYIDIAVVQRDMVNVLDVGIGSGGCDISLFLDASNEIVFTPIWKNGIQKSRAIEMTVRQTKKAVIANIDDMELCRLCKTLEAEKIYPFSLLKESEDIKYFLQNGSKMVCLQSVDSKGIFLNLYLPKKETMFIEMMSIDKEDIIVLMSAIAFCLSMDLPINHMKEEIIEFYNR